MCRSCCVDRHRLNACFKPKHCTSGFMPCMFWSVLILLSFQSQSISGSDLNSTALITDVSADPAVLRKVKRAMLKVFWRHVKRGDVLVLTGVQSVSARGMPDRCWDSVSIFHAMCLLIKSPRSRSATLIQVPNRTLGFPMQYSSTESEHAKGNQANFELCQKTFAANAWLCPA